MNKSSSSENKTAYIPSSQHSNVTVELANKKKEFLIPVLMESLYTHYNEPRESVHLSDLTLCVREQVFRRINPYSVQARELNYFILGKSSHEAAQILAKRYPERFEVEKEVWHNDLLVAHVDLYDKIANVPFEMKTYRGKNPDAPKAHQLTQVKGYMAMLGASKGY